EVIGRIAMFLGQIVKSLVLFAVHGFLTDKARYLRFQQRIFNALAVVFNRIDKEGFALRKQRRQRGPEGGQVGAVSVPVTLGVFGEHEIHAARRNIGQSAGGLTNSRGGVGCLSGGLGHHKLPEYCCYGLVRRTAMWVLKRWRWSTRR